MFCIGGWGGGGIGDDVGSGDDGGGVLFQRSTVVSTLRAELAVKWYVLTINRYVLTINGYVLTINWYVLTINGYVLTINGYVLTINGYVLTIKRAEPVDNAAQQFLQQACAL